MNDFPWHSGCPQELGLIKSEDMGICSTSWWGGVEEVANPAPLYSNEKVGGGERQVEGGYINKTRFAKKTNS